MNRNLSNCENSPKKVFGVFNGIRTRGLCVSAAVLSQLSYEDPYIYCLNCDSLRWSHTHFICIPAVHIILFSVSFLSRVDELNKLACLQYMGLHSSAGRALRANAEATGSNPVEAPKNFFSGYFRNCLNCDSLRWSHTHFICIPAVHIISFNILVVNHVYSAYSCSVLSELWRSSTVQ